MHEYDAHAWATIQHHFFHSMLIHIRVRIKLHKYQIKCILDNSFLLSVWFHLTHWSSVQRKTNTFDFISQIKWTTAHFVFKWNRMRNQYPFRASSFCFFFIAFIFVRLARIFVSIEYVVITILKKKKQKYSLIDAQEKKKR